MSKLTLGKFEKCKLFCELDYNFLLILFYEDRIQNDRSYWSLYYLDTVAIRRNTYTSNIINMHNTQISILVVTMMLIYKIHLMKHSEINKLRKEMVSLKKIMYKSTIIITYL